MVGCCPPAPRRRRAGYFFLQARGAQTKRSGWFDGSRRFCAFLNGANGEWTNTDDLADRETKNDERKRRHKEAETNKHRTVPGKYKGKSGAKPKGGDKNGKLEFGAACNNDGNLIMGGGVARGVAPEFPKWLPKPEFDLWCAKKMEEALADGEPVNLPAWKPKEEYQAWCEERAARLAAKQAAHEGKRVKPQEKAPGANLKPPAVVPSSDTSTNEETDKPREETESVSDGSSSENQDGDWYQTALANSAAQLTKEFAEITQTRKYLGEPTEEYEDCDAEELAELRVSHMVHSRRKAAMLAAKEMARKGADDMAKAIYRRIVPVDEEARFEAQEAARAIEKKRLLDEYMREYAPHVPRVKLPLVVQRDIPLYSAEPECCSFSYFQSLFSFSGYGRPPNPDIHGDRIDPYTRAYDDDNTVWHVKLGYRRSYPGDIYPEMAEHLCGVYLPTATYTEAVLSRMNYDSLKWYEDQSFTEPINYAVQSNTINWVVVQNQVTRARMSTRLALGSTASVRVTWK